MTPDGLIRIEGFARDGLSDEQIAQKMGISTTTYYQWQNDFPDISEAIKKGKAPVDIEVENALLKRAKGYTVTETIEEMYRDPETNKITGQHIRRVTKEIPPDVGAIVFWLKNRKPGRWRDKIETAPETGNEILTSLFSLMQEGNHD